MGVKSQVEDYAHRGLGLSPFSVLHFTVNTYEDYISIEQQMDDIEGPDMEADEVIDFHEETERLRSSRRGRRKNDRWRYLASHSRSRSVQRVVRSVRHNTLPSIVGPFFPRSDDEQTYSFYCACMLMLLKPWRKLRDLKNDEQTWEDAFSEMKTNASQFTLRVLSGIQYYYESRSAAERARVANELEDDLNTIADRQRRRNFVDDEADEAMDAEGAIIEGGTVEVTLTENDLESFIQNQRNAAEEAHGKMAVRIGQLMQVFTAANPTWSSIGTGQMRRICMADDALKMTEWEKQLKDASQQNSGGREYRQEPPTDTGDVSMANEGDVVDVPPTVSAMDDSADNTHQTNEEEDGVCVHDLFEEQRRAFDIVERHLCRTLSGEEPDQLLMHIPGEGGVGKSKVIQTITELFQRKEVEHMLVKASYTGIAASLIGGSTLHSMTGIPPQGGHRQSGEMENRQQMFWREKNYLIIDEISMVSSKFFAKIERVISKAKAYEGGPGPEYAF